MRGFGDALRGIATDPVFIAGANIYQGNPVASSMAQAQRTSALAEQAKHQSEIRKRQQEMQQQWQQFAQSGQAPQAMQPYLQFMSPQQGASALASHALGAPERERRAQMDALRMQQMQKAINAPPARRYMKSGNQIVEIGPDGKPNVVHQAPQSPVERLKAQLLQSLMGGQQPAQQPPAQLQPQSAPDGTPRMQPMSAEQPPQDPNLIRTQGGAQPAPGINLTPEQRQALGLNMVIPGAGNILMKGQAAADRREMWKKPTQNKIDEKILNTVEQSSRLSEIEKQFRPEFQTVGGGLKALGAKWWEKLRGQGSLDPTTQKYMQDYAAYKQGAIANINAYIKEVTGAQMSEAEAKRLRQGMPDPGDDPFSGDSPSEFIAKLRDKHRLMRLAMARYNFLRSGRWKGGVFTGSMAKGAPISLDQMQGIMRQRRRQLMQEAKLRAPQNPQAYMAQRMQEEFGI